MDLSTRYLGFDLPHPFMVGACPLADDMDRVRRLEDAGSAAIVLRSLFEEQLTSEQLAAHDATEGLSESFAEALSYAPSHPDNVLGPDDYLAQVRRIREAVDVPVFASLNGATDGGWLAYGKLMEDAGAHALELNLYDVPADANRSAGDVEEEHLRIVRRVVDEVEIPVAVKISPFYSSPAHFARALEGAGAAGLIVFNRFFEPDIDIESLELERCLELSRPSHLLLRVHWLAILSAQIEIPLAVTGGVHAASDAVKAIMAGASAVQMVSALLEHGPERLASVRQGVADWLEEHEYDSLGQMRGSMNLKRCPDPAALQRLNYMHVLQSWTTGS